MILLPIAGGGAFFGCLYLLFIFYIELRIFIFLVKKLFCLSKKIILAAWKFLRSQRTRAVFSAFKLSVVNLYYLFIDGLRGVSYRIFFFAIVAILLSFPLSILVGLLHGILAILYGYSTEMADMIFWLYFWGSYPILFIYLFKRIKRFGEKRFPSDTEVCQSNVS